MAQGIVKWFNEAKGFGFIEPNEGGEIFVHWSALKLDGNFVLQSGEVVKFDIHEGGKGPEAQNVMRVF